MKKRTVEESRDLLEELVNDKFIFDKMEYKKAKSKINFTCKKCGHTFQRTLGNYQRTDKCPYCEGKINKWDTESFIEKLKRVWGDTLDYSKVNYTDIDSKITLICKKHNHEYNQTAYEAKKGQHGCKECASEKQSKTLSKPLSYHKDEIFKALRDRVTLLRRYEEDSTYGIFKCNEHNIEFKQYLSHAKKGVLACPECIKKYILPHSGDHNKIELDAFLSRVEPKFTKLDSSKVKLNTLQDEIEVTCKEHGTFKKKAMYLLKSTFGCNKCAEEHIHKRYHRVPTWLYYVSMEYKGKNYYKVGITKGEDILKDRFAGKEHKKLNIKVLLSIKYHDGIHAYHEEQRYLKKFSKYKISEDEYFLRAGNTEVFNTDVFNVNKK